MNVICITGNLTADPELRTTSTGKSVVSFTVAVRKAYKPKEGPDSDFMRVQAWEKQAEYIANYGGKGRKIAVSGRLESRSYTDKDGNKRESWEVVAENAEYLDKPRDEQGQGAKQSGATTQAPVDEPYSPFEDE